MEMKIIKSNREGCLIGYKNYPESRTEEGIVYKNGKLLYGYGTFLMELLTVIKLLDKEEM